MNSSTLVSMQHDGSGLILLPESMNAENEIGISDDRERYSTNDGNTESKKNQLIYGVDETPHWVTLIVLALQNFLMMISGIVGIPLLLSTLVCLRTDIESYAHLISSTFLIQGLVTFTQSTLGVRLPVVQGASFSFIPAAISLSIARGECPAITSNITDQSEIWEPRLSEVNGGLFLASTIQVVLGFTGLSGFILRFIGPMSIGPCIGLLAIDLIGAVWPSCSVHWGISAATMFFSILFSQYLKNINVTSCLSKRQDTQSHINGKIFQLFPIIMAAVIGWFFAFFLTVGGALPDDPQNPTYFARTDFGNQFIADAPWFTLPTPVARRLPDISITATFGMLAGILASIVESMGDYNACASLSNVPPPPHHAVNRGVLIEGLGCVLSGLWGTGTGTGTYSGNIVAIGMTRVASRRVTQGTAVLIILAGIFGKLTAVLASIPDPVIGGVLGALTGMILSVAITIIQQADMKSPRNLFIVGFSFFTGISIPAFLRANPDAIQTGLPGLDEVLQILLSTGMFVGGFVGFVLDNTVPGTFEERGMLSFQAVDKTSEDRERLSVYDLPFGMERIRSSSWTKFFPLCPTFQSFSFCKTKCTKESIEEPAIEMQ